MAQQIQERFLSQHALTQHAWERMGARSISVQTLQAVLDYGRICYTRGARYHVIGKKEVERHRKHGLDLSPYEGVHVACSTQDATVITVYRNGDLRNLRPRSNGRPRRGTQRRSA